MRALSALLLRVCIEQPGSSAELICHHAGTPKATEAADAPFDRSSRTITSLRCRAYLRPRDERRWPRVAVAALGVCLDEIPWIGLIASNAQKQN